MQVKVFLAGNRMVDGTFREKNNNKVESFLTLSLMSTITWITEKELKLVIENKGD